MDIRQFRRAQREGYKYKAGEKAAGLDENDSEYIVILEADFVTRPLPYIMADPQIGIAQARCGYLIDTYNAITRAQCLSLDGHLVAEPYSVSWRLVLKSIIYGFLASMGYWQEWLVMRSFRKIGDPIGR